MAKSDVEVRIKMSPLQAGKMYVENMRLEKENAQLKQQLAMLNEAAGTLSKDGAFRGIEVIDDVWHDGGGAPVYLEDVIDLLNKDAQAGQEGE